jgi:hypothetical protein
MSAGERRSLVGGQDHRYTAPIDWSPAKRLRVPRSVSRPRGDVPEARHHLAAMDWDDFDEDGPDDEDESDHQRESVSEPDRISVRSVARDVAEADPIVLRQSDRTRLVFLPTLVDQDEHPLRGHFVWQRKRTKDEWDDLRGRSLSALKSGEGFALELHSAEVTLLIKGLLDLKDLYREHGIVRGTQEFVLKSTLPRMVQDIIDAPTSELAAALRQLDEQTLLNLGRRVDVSKLDALLSEWETIRGSAAEGAWQELFASHAWLFSQLTGSPIVVLQEKAYVGGKSIANTSGGQVDFLLRNDLTDNVVFVEIKTPRTPIIAGAYRSSGAFALDKEVSGGLVQVLGYKERFEKEFYALAARSQDSMHSYNPRCFVIIGEVSDLEESELRCLDLFRNSLAGVQILTFDEVEARLHGIRDALTS